MRPEEIQAKADSLSTALNVKVHPILFVDETTKEQVIGYIKEPPRLVKYRYLDKAMSGPMSAAAELLEACLIKEHSDQRIYSEAPENDKFNIGAATACASLLQVSVDTLKKN